MTNAQPLEPQQARQFRISLALTETSRILEPPPVRNAGEWANENRVLPPESPEPGKWRTDRVPFWRDIYAAFTAPDVDTVVVCCGAQMGKTESMFNILGHRFTDGPFVPALYVGPTEKQVKSISKDRIDKMLRSTPALWNRTERGQRYGVFEKWIAGVRLGFAWAGSATELSSHPAGLVLVDERDRMLEDVGHEGDPVSLARARTKNYAFRKVGVFSTPTTEGASPTWALLEAGRLHFWAFPCLECRVWFVPQLSLLRWPKGCTANEALTEARLHCPHCEHGHESKHKQQLNALGRYLIMRRLAETEANPNAVLGHYAVDPEPPPNRTASFWISGLASPWASFGEIAKVMIEAYADGSPERIQAEVNTWGGELFRMQGDAPEWTEVGANRLEYAPRTIQPGIQRITCGVDTQRSGLFFTTRGWGFNSESWLLEHGFLAGETEYDAVWQALREVLNTPIGDRKINRCFIDSGYRPGDVYKRPDHAVYTFARSMPGLAYPAKGWDQLDGPYRFRNIDYSIGGQVIRGGVRLFHVNTDLAKRWIHARVRWPEGEPGGWHLHRETTEDYCRQIVAEELVLKASGKAHWLRRSRNNHYLDAEVLALIAALSINVHKLPKEAPEQTKTNAPRLPPKPPPGYERRTI